MEGIPPIILGIITIFYLTDRPEQARWLAEDERNWISRELKEEALAKKSVREYTILQAFGDKQIILLILAYFLALVAAQANTFWLPTFIKRLSGLPNTKVALLAALPGLVGIAAMLLNGWHSDKTGERRWHTAAPLFCAALAYVLLLTSSHNFALSLLLFVVGGGMMFAYYPVFWSMPTMVLTESAAAACFGLINSIGHTGGFVGPYVVGRLNQATGSLLSAFAFIGACYLFAAGIISGVRMQAPSRTEGAGLLRDTVAVSDSRNLTA